MAHTHTHTHAHTHTHTHTRLDRRNGGAGEEEEEEEEGRDLWGVCSHTSSFPRQRKLNHWDAEGSLQEPMAHAHPRDTDDTRDHRPPQTSRIRGREGCAHVHVQDFDDYYVLHPFINDGTSASYYYTRPAFLITYAYEW